MTVGVTEEHLALADMVRRLAEERALVTEARAGYDGEAPRLPASWPAIAEQGLLGMHIGEEHGGGGAGPVELVIALAELGGAVSAGPVLPTVLAALVIERHGAPELAKRVLPGLADGSVTAAVALDSAPVRATQDGERLQLDGKVGPVLCAGQADLLLVGGRVGDEERWVVLDAEAVAIVELAAFDRSRTLGEIVLDGVEIPADRLLNGLTGEALRDAAAPLFAAEATGVAGWCLDTAVAYAKVREQFGRPIGKFQAIKHACADMLVRVEQARAAAWDAARAIGDDEHGPVTAAVAAAVCIDAAVDNAKACIQILGGIGYTWEHDAHLYLRRALSLRALLGGGDRWRARVVELALAGDRRELDLVLPSEAEPIREEVDAFISALEGLDLGEQRNRMAEGGYLVPHWPKPWGRDAGAVEQLAIEERFRARGIKRPSLIIGNWALPPIIERGTPEQQQRFVPPSLRGEIVWCQMFSEPGAGSDLASLSTRATRADGGWVLNGQKVWTSMARHAQWAICLARTDPDAPKHEGITFFLVDMATPGIDVRPLTEITGDPLFNEVFLDDVFVPDDCVVGEVNEGWRLARTTLANERVGMSTGSGYGPGVEGVLGLLAERDEVDEAMKVKAGALICESQTAALLGYRITLRQLGGVDPGPASSVRKLIGMVHQQQASELGLELLGPDGARADGVAADWTRQVLSTRALTIAGGTSEILRNVIGERILGLPRDD